MERHENPYLLRLFWDGNASIQEYIQKDLFKIWGQQTTRNHSRLYRCVNSKVYEMILKIKQWMHTKIYTFLIREMLVTPEEPKE